MHPVYRAGLDRSATDCYDGYPLTGEEGEEMRAWWIGGVLLLALVVLVAKPSVVPRIRMALRPGSIATSAPPASDPRATFLLVLNGRNGAIPGATVTVRRDGQEDPVAVATTDAGGGWKFRLPDDEKGWGGLRVRAQMGPLVREVVLRGSPGDHLEIRLPESLTLHGEVFRRETGTPLAGVSVRTGKGTVRTGEDGRFRIAYAPSVQALDGSLRLEVVFSEESAQTFNFPWTDSEGDLLLGVGD